MTYRSVSKEWDVELCNAILKSDDYNAFTTYIWKTILQREGIPEVWQFVQKHKNINFHFNYIYPHDAFFDTDDYYYPVTLDRFS